MKKLIILALMFCFIPVFFAACDDSTSTNYNYSLTLLTDPDSETISKGANPDILLQARVYDSKGNFVSSPGNISWAIKYKQGGVGDYVKVPDEWFTSSKPYNNASLDARKFFNASLVEITAYYYNAKDSVTFTIVT